MSIKSQFTRAQHMRLTGALLMLCLDFSVESEVPLSCSAVWIAAVRLGSHVNQKLFTRAQHMRLTDALPKLFLDFHVESEVPVMLGCLDSSCEKLQRCQSKARSLVHSIFDSQMPCPC